jgi:hypothetical protein
MERQNKDYVQMQNDVLRFTETRQITPADAQKTAAEYRRVYTADYEAAEQAQ